MIYRNLCTITLRRFSSNKICTRGELVISTSKFQTLEPSIPIIPVGAYLLRPTYSPSFSNKYPYNKVLDGRVPEVVGVTGHSGVRLHVGNFPSNTRGCILLGLRGTDSQVDQSAVAYKNFCSILSQFMTDNPNVFFVLIVTDSTANE